MSKSIALLVVMLSLFVTVLWAAAPVPNVITVEGLVLRTHHDQIQVAVLGEETPQAFDVAPDATITRDGVFVTLADLKYGDFARIRAETQGTKLVAIVIEATSKHL